MTKHLNVSNFIFNTECANINLIELNKSEKNGERERDRKQYLITNNISVY